MERDRVPKTLARHYGTCTNASCEAPECGPLCPILPNHFENIGSHTDLLPNRVLNWKEVFPIRPAPRTQTSQPFFSVTFVRRFNLVDRKRADSVSRLNRRSLQGLVATTDGNSSTSTCAPAFDLSASLLLQGQVNRDIRPFGPRIGKAWPSPTKILKTLLIDSGNFWSQSGSLLGYEYWHLPVARLPERRRRR